MQFVANLWWLWLVLALATFLYGGYNQVTRMRRMSEGRQDAFSRGLYALFVAGALHFVFLVLTITSIVLNIIDYARK